MTFFKWTCGRCRREGFFHSDATPENEIENAFIEIAASGSAIQAHTSATGAECPYSTYVVVTQGNRATTEAFERFLAGEVQA